MVIYIFSIPAMSFEIKGDFLMTKNTISDEYLSLLIEIIKTLECLKSWFRAGIFIQDDLFLALRKQLEE